MIKKLESAQDRVSELSRALAIICRTLVDVGLGPVNLGELARHMLKLRRSGKKGRS